MRKNVLSFTAMQRYKKGRKVVQHDWEPALTAPLPKPPASDDIDKLWLQFLLIEGARDEVLVYLKWAATSLAVLYPERVEKEISRASERLLMLMKEFEIAHTRWHDAVKDLEEYGGLPAPGSREEAIQHAFIFKRRECQKLRDHAWPLQG
jgi:hypothetical protein